MYLDNDNKFIETSLMKKNNLFVAAVKSIQFIFKLLPMNSSNYHYTCYKPMYKHWSQVTSLWVKVFSLGHCDSETKRKRAADAFESVMEKMVEHLVPKYLGIEHLGREEAKIHNTSFVKVKYIIFPLNIRRKRQWLNSHKHEPFLSISIIL